MVLSDPWRLRFPIALWIMSVSVLNSCRRCPPALVCFADALDSCILSPVGALFGLGSRSASLRWTKGHSRQLCSDLFCVIRSTGNRHYSCNQEIDLVSCCVADFCFWRSLSAVLAEAAFAVVDLLLLLASVLIIVLESRFCAS